MSCCSEVDANLGTTATILAYIVGQDQQPITKASVTSIHRRIVAESGEVIEADAALDKDNVVFDTLQIDNGWPLNSGYGYNFRDSLLCSVEGKIKVIYTIVDSDSKPIVTTQEILVVNVP